MFSKLKKILPDLTKTIFITFLAVIVFEIIKLSPPYLFKVIIDTVIELKSFESLLYLCFAYLISISIVTAIDSFSELYFSPKIFQYGNLMLLGIFNKLMALDLYYHERNDTGALSSKLIRGSSKFIEMLFNVKEALIPIIIQTIITAVVLLYIEWKIGIIFVLVLPFFIFFTLRFSRKTHKVRDLYHQNFDSAAQSFCGALRNIRTVKDFDTAKKESRQVAGFLDAFLKNLMIRVKMGSSFMFARDSAINLTRVGTLILSIYFVTKGVLSMGDLVFIMTLTEKSFINLARLGRVYFKIEDAKTSVMRFTQINDEPIGIIGGNLRNKVKSGSVLFENVTFAYHNKPVLKNISFDIPSKSTVALVGRSGAGKSTVIKLLLRHFDTTKGSVLIDGANIKDYSLSSLRKAVSVVSQDVDVFNDTIYKNIAYGKRISKRDAVKAAKTAYCHEFISMLPKGYDTVIGEKGIKLSGGQKQRLAIARALVMNPKILIFDEATSSLDSESERFIQKSLFGLMGSCTMIIIAHRFSTIEHVDKIILFDNGKIAEQGTHKDLIKHGGLFSKLRNLQKLGDLS